MMARNAIGHCGYELFPARRDGRPLFDWMTTVTHHDLHHAHAGWNLGLYFTWWDRWMGTEHPEYHARFRAAAKSRRRLDIAGPAISGVLAIGLLVYPKIGQALELSGHWVTQGMGAVVRFEPCEADHRNTCGRLVWAWSEDTRSHLKIGQVMIRDLRWTGKRWENGRLINPENGRTYEGSISRVGRDIIRLKGCAGFLCATQDWRSLGSIRQLDQLRRFGLKR